MPTWNEMMYWDCPSCDTKRIEGVIDSCPSCGNAHDVAEAPWYAAGEANYENRIRDPVKNRQALAGPNWTCKHCGGTQRRDDGECVNCAAPRSEGDTSAKKVPTKGSPRARDRGKTAGRAASATTRACSNCGRPVPTSLGYCPSCVELDSREIRGFRNSWVMPGVGLASALALVFMIWLLFHKSAVTIDVDSVTWSHIVNVERKVQVHEEGFEESMPPFDPTAETTAIADRSFDFEVIDRERYHHTDQVRDGFRTEHYSVQEACGTEAAGTTPVVCSTNGNGTRTCSGGNTIYRTKYCTRDRTRQVQKYRDVKRYAAWYKWLVWRWKVLRSPTHTGTTTVTSWPSDEELCLNCEVRGLEEERVGKKITQYEVHFVDRESGKVYTLRPATAQVFARYPVGSHHDCLYSVALGVDCGEEFK